MRNLLVLMILVASVGARAAVVVDPKLWARIDAANAELAKAPPADAEVPAHVLQEAVELIHGFDAEYQRIRADAFDTTFTQAEGLAKRAAPVFVLAFDGDTDTEQVSFATFAHAAPAGSPLARFLSLYKETYGALGAGGDLGKCQLPFDLPKAGAKAKKGKAAASKKWSDLQATLPEGLLKSFAQSAPDCLK